MLSLPALQEAVDEGRLAFNPAVEVSYLDEADQEIVQEIMDRDQISPSLSQAQKLHRLAQIDKIDDSAIEAGHFSRKQAVTDKDFGVTPEKCESLFRLLHAFCFRMFRLRRRKQTCFFQVFL